MKESRALRRPFLQILIPGALYAGLFFMRPFWFSPRCAANPTPCSPSGLNGIDQLALSHASVFADFCSNVLQNTVGAVAFLLPWILVRPWSNALRLNSSLLSITLMNAAALEGVRALIQRPRPQVFAAPLIEGKNIHLYTSFYSGHTSFVALASVFTVLWIGAARPDQGLLKKTGLFIALILTAATGILRVLGGRHFPTDVMAGALIGAGISVLYFRKTAADPPFSAPCRSLQN